MPGAGTTPVSIDNVNCGNPFDDVTPAGNNCNLYRNNDLSDGGGGINTEMDGLTLVFTATGSLIPGVNHIKLAIADAGDSVLDSNVFIRSESFTCELPTGACCDTSNFTCQNNVLEADCQNPGPGPGNVWSAGLDCAVLDPPCEAPCGNGIVEPALGEDCDPPDGQCCSATCTFEVMGTACGDSSNTECTDPDTCNATGTCQDNHASTTTTCGDTGTDCTNQDLCNGSGGVCYF